jgi:hypothetical protein
VDAPGNIYIADGGNHRIRKVDTGGTITTVAGNGAGGYSGDNGPATSAKLNAPKGVAIDSSGDIYIADTENHRIRKVDAGGNISTVAGNGTAGYSGDNGPARSAKLSSPWRVALDASRNICISDTSNNRIRKVTDQCTGQPDGTSCDDGNLCTIGDVCASGSCQQGAPKNCSDGKACTNDICTEGVCSNPVNCALGSVCDLNGTCAARPLASKIGVYSNGNWYLDKNQNWSWDGEPTDTLGLFGLGLTGAIPVVGDWNGDGKAEIAVFVAGVWYLDRNGNGRWDGEGTDVRGEFGLGFPNAVPVTGDWNGDGITEIGLYSSGSWYLDKNRNWSWDDQPGDTQYAFGYGLPNAVPVTGDWNGDGITEIGVYSNGNWYLDMNGNGHWDGTPTDTSGVFGLGLPNVVPVTGDWNSDGITEIGVYANGNWYLDKNKSWAWDGTPTDTFSDFGFGLPNMVPVVGNW